MSADIQSSWSAAKVGERMGKVGACRWRVKTFIWCPVLGFNPGNAKIDHRKTISKSLATYLKHRQCAIPTWDDVLDGRSQYAFEKSAVNTAKVGGDLQIAVDIETG
jgi:hypothetical protein